MGSKIFFQVRPFAGYGPARLFKGFNLKIKYYTKKYLPTTKLAIYHCLFFDKISHFLE